MSKVRPSSVPYPKVWSRFISDGIRFRVEDLTEPCEQQALDLLTAYFVRDEPPCKHIGLQKHPSALAELQKLWRTTMADRLSLACVVDEPGDTRIVGVNVLTVANKDDDEAFESSDPVWSMLFGAVDLVTRSVDVFQKYGVDKYLTAYGLVVDPEYRGKNIGTELLKARIPLCKALGIGVTATVFTAIASQKIAEKAGFQTLSEVSYEDMARQHGILFPGVSESTRSSKLMALVVE